MGSTDIFVAKESFTVTLNGENHQVSAGKTRVRAGHPLLKGREMYFEPLTVQYDVEQATAKPGEKRAAPEPVVAPPAPPVAPVEKPVEKKPSGLTTASLSPKKASE